MEHTCGITNKTFSADEMIPVQQLRKPLIKIIKQHYPEVDLNGQVSLEAVQQLRKAYIEQLLIKELGDITELEKEVIGSITENQLLSQNIEIQSEKSTSLGDRVADKVAAFGGSWTFIIIFFMVLIVWMGINIFIFNNKGFDPYPFILLNLLLSCIAAIQAPIIMMSQNRQETKDRTRGEHDYKINLKAELEVRLLHEKIDHILQEQKQKLHEIEKMHEQVLQLLNTASSKNNS